VSQPEAFMLVVVALLGLCAGWRNVTAGALVASYLAVMVPYWGWGISFPTPVGVLFDATVIMAMFCKAPAFHCLPYGTLGAQFCWLWLERSYWDRFVIALFGASWLVYLAPVSAADRWWPLWTIALAQYLAAGGEALQASLSARSAKAGTEELERAKPSSMEFAGVGVRGYG
jgi:hypothetical protein